MINALSGHLAEFGPVAPKGQIHLEILQIALKGSEVGLPAPTGNRRGAAAQGHRALRADEFSAQVLAQVSK